MISKGVSYMKTVRSKEINKFTRKDGGSEKNTIKEKDLITRRLKVKRTD